MTVYEVAGCSVVVVYVTVDVLVIGTTTEVVPVWMVW